MSDVSAESVSLLCAMQIVEWGSLTAEEIVFKLHPGHCLLPLFV